MPFHGAPSNEPCPMSPLPAFDRRSAILQRIAASVSRRRLFLGDHCSIIKPPRTVSGRPVQCLLPLPEPLTEELIRLGFNVSAAAQTSDLYVRTANKLRSVVESGCVHTLRSLRLQPGMEVIEDNYIAMHKSYYLKTLDCWADELKKRVRTRLLSISEKITKRRFLSHDPDGRLRRTRKSRRTTFNHVSSVATHG
jgi:hypothetical protein